MDAPSFASDSALHGLHTLRHDPAAARREGAAAPDKVWTRLSHFVGDHLLVWALGGAEAQAAVQPAGHTAAHPLHH